MSPSRTFNKLNPSKLKTRRPRYRDPREPSPAWQVAVRGSAVWRTCNVCGHRVNDDGKMSQRVERNALLVHKRDHADPAIKVS